MVELVGGLSLGRQRARKSHRSARRAAARVDRSIEEAVNHHGAVAFTAMNHHLPRRRAHSMCVTRGARTSIGLSEHVEYLHETRRGGEEGRRRGKEGEGEVGARTIERYDGVAEAWRDRARATEHT